MTTTTLNRIDHPTYDNIQIDYERATFGGQTYYSVYARATSGNSPLTVCRMANALTVNSADKDTDREALEQAHKRLPYLVYTVLRETGAKLAGRLDSLVEPDAFRAMV